MPNIKQDKIIIKLLKLGEIRHRICETNHGPLDLLLRKGEEEYTLTLDSNPVKDITEKEQFEALQKLLNVV